MFCSFIFGRPDKIRANYSIRTRVRDTVLRVVYSILAVELMFMQVGYHKDKPRKPNVLEAFQDHERGHYILDGRSYTAESVATIY